jgi:hypothetical protein
MFDARDHSGNALAAENLSLRLSLVESELKGSTSASSEEVEPLVIPAVGCIQHGLLKINTISVVNIAGEARLVRPLSDSTMTFEDGAISVNLDSVFVEAMRFGEWNKSVQGKTVNQPKPLTYTMDLPLHFTMKRLVLLPHAEIGSPGLCVETVIRLKPLFPSTRQRIGETRLRLEYGGGIGLELSGDSSDGFAGWFANDGSKRRVGKALHETFHSGGHGGSTV